MNFKALVFLLSLTPVVYAKTIKIAVIDTGYRTSSYTFKKCPGLEKDFSGEGMNDYSGHGQNVAHIISNDITGLDYCIIPIKAFVIKDGVKDSINKSILALNYAFKLNVDIVNYSAGGLSYSEREKKLIKKMLNKGIILVMAAGNNGSNLDFFCGYYPACYDDRIAVVGGLDRDLKRAVFSNYGKVVQFWDIGEKVSAGGYTLSGTSQATAKVTARFVKYITKSN